jgi:hypothetical protein
VWRRDSTADEDWVRLPYPVAGTSWVAGGLVAGHRYEFRLQAVKGTAVADDYSNVVAVVPTGPVDPGESRPGAPRSVSAVAGPNQLSVSWTPVASATSYDITWTSDLPGGDGTRSAVVGPVVLTDLVAGQKYRVSVVARNSAGTGAATVTTGTPTSQGVSGLQAPRRVTAVPGSHRLKVAWAPVAGATGYEVAWVGRRLKLRGWTIATGTTVTLDHLLAGERYDLTITALNDAGPGPAATTRGVPRGPRVAGPTRVRAGQVGPHRVLLTWRARAAATSYAVVVRRHGKWEPVGTTVAPSLVVRGLPRGVARFRVQSWHQLVAGRWSRVVQLPLRP